MGPILKYYNITCSFGTVNRRKCSHHPKVYPKTSLFCQSSPTRQKWQSWLAFGYTLVLLLHIRRLTVQQRIHCNTMNCLHFCHIVFRFIFNTCSIKYLSSLDQFVLIFDTFLDIISAFLKLSQYFWNFAQFFPKFSQ